MPPIRLRALYAIDVPGKVFQMGLQAFLMGASGAALCMHYTASAVALRELLPWLPVQVTGLLIGLLASFCLLLAFAYSFTLMASLHTSLVTRPRMAAHMISLVPDWSTVSLALDLGCGRGTQLCLIAHHLRQQIRCSARAVGFDSWRPPKFRGYSRSRSSGHSSPATPKSPAVAGGRNKEGEISWDGTASARERERERENEGERDRESESLRGLRIEGGSVKGFSGLVGGHRGNQIDRDDRGDTRDGRRPRDRDGRAEELPGVSVSARPRPVERVGESEVGTEVFDQTAAGSMALTLRAAAAEGVGSLVTCKLGSFRALPFQAGLFDVVLSALKLHQIALRIELRDPEHARSERRQVLEEVLRVLKPGGRLLLWDFVHVASDTDLFASAGFVGVKVHAAPKAFLQPTALVVACKPK